MQLWEEMEYKRLEGKAEGETLTLIRQIRKKLEKNLAMSEIADILEESESRVQSICDAITRYPELTDDELAEMIYEQSISNEN